jgi:uncharacterized protein GlcG (DUF336 family)
MGLFANLFGQPHPKGQASAKRGPYARLQGPEPLESRSLLSVSTNLSGGVLSITGDNGRNHIEVNLNASQTAVVVSDGGILAGQFASTDVQSIAVTTGSGDNTVVINPNVLQPAIIKLGNGKDVAYAGGGPTTIEGGTGQDKMVAGTAPDLLISGGGKTSFFQVKSSDAVVNNPGDQVFAASQPPASSTGDPNTTVLTTDDVSQLLQRAAAATGNDTAIVAVVDRGGRVLGVRVEGGVSSAITSNPATLTFAIDGAISLARTGAFFSSNAAPLTSRTVQFISQSTIIQREVDSNPDVPDTPNSTIYGPGFVAPVEIGGHFPPNIQYTPTVDLAQIEQTNRDSSVTNGSNGRFNVPTQYIPSSIPADEQLQAPDSYGVITGLDPTAQSRGMATLPGGIPLYKDGVLVGGIGVFFPGTTGYATAENSSLSNTYDPSKPDLSLEAEYIAYAAAGGSSGAGYSIGTLGGIPALPGFDLPFGRIDLNGITLNIYGPDGTQGPRELVTFGQTLGTGDPNSGVNMPVTKGANGQPSNVTLQAGVPVPDGWLVTPHAGGGITADEVTQMIQQGIAQADLTRAAIRLPLGSRTKMIFAVTDSQGDVLGLYRMPDAAIFSIGVSVAKARNVAYYNDPSQLQPADQVPGIPAGTAFTARTFRYLALPFYPESVDGDPPGPFSILNDSNTPLGLQVGNPLPVSAFQSVEGYTAFNPNANFHDPNNPANQNGVVYFPGSSAVYVGGPQVLGGLGVSGDGVDQDDVVTYFAAQGFGPPAGVLRADQTFFNSVRLPYQKFNRNPEG